MFPRRAYQFPTIHNSLARRKKRLEKRACDFEETHFSLAQQKDEPIVRAYYLSKNRISFATTGRIRSFHRDSIKYPALATYQFTSPLLSAQP